MRNLADKWEQESDELDAVISNDPGSAAKVLIEREVEIYRRLMCQLEARLNVQAQNSDDWYEHFKQSQQ